MSKAKRKSPLWELQQRKIKEGICAMCGKHQELFVDHIFPASLLMLWGIQQYTWEDADNLQLLCRACNLLKGAHFDFRNVKTIPLIEKYINILKKTYNNENKS